MGPRRVPALLFDATFYGTLAAVRSLGRDGVPVAVADARRVAPATWSRYATRSLRSPPVADAAALLDWLVRFGTHEGRHVLYPTSDEVTYLLSAHREALAGHFAMYQPDLDVTLRILDKKRLMETAREVGIATPPTVFPRSGAEAERFAREIDGPLLFKPRAQLFRAVHAKGALVRRREDVAREYDAFRRASVYLRPVRDRMPELTEPMLERFYPDGGDGVLSVSGFRSRGGRELVMLGAVKVLQRPRRLGIGLCFESTPLEPSVRDAAKRLLERLDYFGVFEIELIRVGGQHLLIDMNPRYYNQMQLDIARGMDSPRIAYAASMGDDAAVSELAARVPREAPGRAFRNGIGLRILVGAQRAFGRMSSAEALQWDAWAEGHGAGLVDSVASRDDLGPVVADGAAQVYGCLRHPFGFIRTMAET
jgi:D-aspartate ligase